MHLFNRVLFLQLFFWQILLADEGEQLFSLKVRNILSSKCYACHGGDPSKIKGGLDLTSRLGMLKGGESGLSSLLPGKPLESPLYIASARNNDDEWSVMPPKENDKLSSKQLIAIKRWIDLGAPWPDKKTQLRYVANERGKRFTEDGILIDTSGGLSDDWTYRRYNPEDIWAFMPVKKPKLPIGGLNPVDSFIRSKLGKENIKPSAQAHFRDLVRRAYLDLHGLPPTPYQVYQFRLEWDRNPDKAWSDLIEQLLKSPHYGERSAQHWLDVARYADTAGLSNDYERSNMWRYRDYVTRAFNADKPYNRFIIEQIAGDELWEAQPKDHKSSDLLVATSFLRMGPWDPAMVLKPQARQLYLDDVVNSVGQTFLSTTMRCFKCHDHKFDPLPTRDYYRFYSAFSTTQLAERPAPFSKQENLLGLELGRKATQRMLDFAKNKYQTLYSKQEDAAKTWYSERGKEYLDENKRRSLPDEEKPPRHVGLTPVEQGRLKVRRQDDWIWSRRMERYEPMAQSVYNGPVPKSLNARKMRMPNKVAKITADEATPILLGGALEAPGDPVRPGVLSALAIPTTEDPSDPYLITDSTSGRRLALARWIAHPKNPLTARSIVNRVWQRHFGKPLAGNPNNFGAKGAKPTHPGLLEWLAADFVENGWQFKRLHRLIMSSETYRQSTSHPNIKKLREVDPNNHFLAYREPRRLTAEELRDGMLVSSGELNRQVGGLPSMPEINMEVALQPRMIQFSLAPAYQPSALPEQRNRRTLYSYRVRGQPDPFLELFNQPNPNDSCEERVSESVSPQAFTLLNSSLMADRAIALALRVEREFEDLRTQVKRAVHLAFTRVPKKDEWDRLEKYVVKMRAYHKNHQPERMDYPTSVTRSLVEENTGEPFEYEEILPVFKDYKADKKAYEVNSRTRALADLCLVLFNANEFMYVY